MLEYNRKSTDYGYIHIVEPLGSPKGTNGPQKGLKSGLKQKIDNIEAIRGHCSA